MEVRSCPRCGHVGTGVKHFQRFSHVGVLLGLSVLTWFTFGLGGLAYYVVRRKRMICAQCGLGWQHARIPGPGLAGHPALADPSGTDLVGRGTQFGAGGPLPRGGVGRRVLGVAMILFAALMVMVGAAGGAVEAVVFGTVAGALGTGTLWWGIQAREARRQAIKARLQQRVLLLATEEGGTLTVTGVAASLNLSLSAAEEVLDGMDDGLRVCSEVTNEGIIVYEFPELRHNPRLESGSAG
jgi:ribosomal protein S27AE